MRRRTFLKLAALSGAALTKASKLSALVARGRGRRAVSNRGLYGHWVVRTGVPAFVYDADHGCAAGGGVGSDPVAAARGATG